MTTAQYDKICDQFQSRSMPCRQSVTLLKTALDRHKVDKKLTVLIDALTISMHGFLNSWFLTLQATIYKKCISLDFYLRALREPRNSRKLDFTVTLFSIIFWFLPDLFRYYEYLQDIQQFFFKKNVWNIKQNIISIQLLHVLNRSFNFCFRFFHGRRNNGLNRIDKSRYTVQGCDKFRNDDSSVWQDLWPVSIPIYAMQTKCYTTENVFWCVHKFDTRVAFSLFLYCWQVPELGQMRPCAS
jgi:hypothetical protein